MVTESCIAYKHGKYEKIWLRHLQVMSTVNVFAGKVNMTGNINPYVLVWNKYKRHISTSHVEVTIQDLISMDSAFYGKLLMLDSAFYGEPLKFLLQ